MRKCIIVSRVFFAKDYSVDDINEDKIGGACDTGRREIYTEFGW